MQQGRAEWQGRIPDLSQPWGRPEVGWRASTQRARGSQGHLRNSWRTRTDRSQVKSGVRMTGNHIEKALPYDSMQSANPTEK